MILIIYPVLIRRRSNIQDAYALCPRGGCKYNRLPVFNFSEVNALTSIPPVVINDCSVSYSHSIDSLTPERKYFFKLAFLSRLTLRSQEFLLKKVSSSQR